MDLRTIKHGLPSVIRCGLRSICLPINGMCLNINGLSKYHLIVESPISVRGFFETSWPCVGSSSKSSELRPSIESPQVSFRRIWAPRDLDQENFRLGRDATQRSRSWVLKDCGNESCNPHARHWSKRFHAGSPELNTPQGWQRVRESAPKLECQCPDLPRQNG
jgi:hypothetical protein